MSLTLHRTDATYGTDGTEIAIRVESICGGLKQIGLRYGANRMEGRELRRQMGEFLIELKKICPLGTYEDRVTECGINLITARRAVREVLEARGEYTPKHTPEASDQVDRSRGDGGGWDGLDDPPEPLTDEERVMLAEIEAEEEADQHIHIGTCAHPLGTSGESASARPDVMMLPCENVSMSAAGGSPSGPPVLSRAGGEGTQARRDAGTKPEQLTLELVYRERAAEAWSGLKRFADAIGSDERFVDLSDGCKSLGARIGARFGLSLSPSGAAAPKGSAAL